MSRSHNKRMDDIAEAVDNIKDVIYRDPELNDRHLYKAVERYLEIITEAVRAVLEEDARFFDSEPTVPWKGIVGMRTPLAHKYWDVDRKTIENTVRDRIEPTKHAALRLKR